MSQKNELYDAETFRVAITRNLYHPKNDTDSPHPDARWIDPDFDTELDTDFGEDTPATAIRAFELVRRLCENKCRQPKDVIRAILSLISSIENHIPRCERNEQTEKFATTRRALVCILETRYTGKYEDEVNEIRRRIGVFAAAI
ncbi:MAG: hypothetical protein Q8Q18_01895 [bacterium]|nr:hypothetical protein [bacterium]